MYFMKKLNYIILIVILVLNLASCSKDDSDSSAKEGLLTNKTWITESKVINPVISFNGIEISDIMVLETDAVRNYSFKFNSDGTFFLYDNLDTLIFQTTWSMNSEETQITFAEPIVYTYPLVGDIGLSILNIQSITSSEFVATVSGLYEDINYELTITFI